jgi:hypothetical protein
MLELRPLCARQPDLRASGQSRTHGIEELIFVEWLHQEIGGARLHADYADLDIGEAGHEDDRKSPAAVVDGTLDVEPAKGRHPNVQQ